MTTFRKFVFCATDFYLASRIRYWIFLLNLCRTNQINIYSPKGGSVKPVVGTFLLYFNCLHFWISFHTERNSKMDFPLAQVWSLSRSQRSLKISCIDNCIKKLWLRSENLYFCATDFYLANGVRYWIFLLHGCWTNQINIYSPKDGSVKPVFGTFLLCFNFWIFWISFHTERNSKMDCPLAQIWSLSRSQRSPKITCIGNCIKKLWLRSAELYFAQRIFIWRTEFATGFSFSMDVELIK